MQIIADVHGAVEFLRRTASQPGPLLILGDLINFIDYRTNEGIVTDISGKDFTDRMVELRTAGEAVAAGALWQDFRRGREEELRAAYDAAIRKAYDEILEPLDRPDCFVTYGNVDRPDLMRTKLPAQATFIDTGVVEIEGYSVGFAGGGIVSINTPGEVSEPEMAEKLESLGSVDILCTHVPPAVNALAQDVVGGRAKGSTAVLDYIRRHKPKWHYFGDVHQPQATTWRVAETICRNVGYFRATGRASRHG